MSEAMKTAMRRQLARQPFEEKIRKVGELIQLTRKVKAQRLREDEPDDPRPATGQSTSDRNPQ